MYHAAITRSGIQILVESIPTLAYVLDRYCAIGSILRYIHTSERRHVCVNTGPFNKSHLTSFIFVIAVALED